MDGRHGAVLKVGDHYELRFERRLNHPPQKVWAAITGPGQMSRWFDTTQMPEDLKVGSVIRFHHAVIDQWSEGHVTRLEPGRLIEWEWRGVFGPPNPISWEITPEPGGGCLLVMRQRTDDPSILARTLAGWDVCIQRLEAAAGDRGDLGGVGGWAPLFEAYKQDLLAAGITEPQAGKPPPPPKP